MSGQYTFSNLVGSVGNAATSSFIQINNATDGTTVFINGEQYEEVVRVVLERTRHRRTELPAAYAATGLQILVTGDCGRIDSSSGNVTVEGDCGDSIRTMSGSVSVGQDCAGSVSTMSGSVEVSGGVRGSVSTMSGAIRHGQAAQKPWKPKKAKRAAVEDEKTKRAFVEVKDEAEEDEEGQGPAKKVKLETKSQ